MHMHPQMKFERGKTSILCELIPRMGALFHPDQRTEHPYVTSRWPGDQTR